VGSMSLLIMSLMLKHGKGFHDMGDGEWDKVQEVRVSTTGERMLMLMFVVDQCFPLLQGKKRGLEMIVWSY
jgi:hypothetical protein